MLEVTHAHMLHSTASWVVIERSGLGQMQHAGKSVGLLSCVLTFLGHFASSRLKCAVLTSLQLLIVRHVCVLRGQLALPTVHHVWGVK